MESDELLVKWIALKGGTAINLTIFDLPRLSVDIDLDFNTFSIYQVLPQLIELWGLNVKTDVEAKKTSPN